MNAGKYTAPRFFKRPDDTRWQAVGVDNSLLQPVCSGVVLGIVPWIEVRLESGQIVRIKPLTPEQKRLRALGFR